MSLTIFSLFFQAVLINMILNYIENPEESVSNTVSYGVGLSIGLFTTECCKALLISLLWAINLRTAVRLKGAFSTVAFQKIISLRVYSGVSMGEVKTSSHFYGKCNIATFVWESFNALVIDSKVILSTCTIFLQLIVYRGQCNKNMLMSFLAKISFLF